MKNITSIEREGYLSGEIDYSHDIYRLKITNLKLKIINSVIDSLYKISDLTDERFSDVKIRLKFYFVYYLCVFDKYELIRIFNMDSVSESNILFCTIMKSIVEIDYYRYYFNECVKKLKSEGVEFMFFDSKINN